MRSTMQNLPLSIARVLDYAATVHGATKVTTFSDGQSQVTTFAEIGARAAALAHALHDDLGITGDQRWVACCITARSIWKPCSRSPAWGRCSIR